MATAASALNRKWNDFRRNRVFTRFFPAQSLK